jgi:hypothetical protein
MLATAGRVFSMRVRTILRRFPAISLAVFLTLGTGVAVLAAGDGAHPGPDDPPAAAQSDDAPPAHANNDQAPPSHASDDDAPPAHANNDEAPPAHANDEASDREDGDHEGNASGQREIKGIPDENPNFDLDSGSSAEASDCDAGDTDIKTTPAGVRVNVPCHAAAHQGLALGHADPPGRRAGNDN